MPETPQPTLTPLPLSHPSSTPPASHFVHQIHGLLTPQECRILIASHKDLVPSNVTPNTIRTRELFTDHHLASLIWSRLPFYHSHKIVDEANHTWRAIGLNERFRLCKYEKGGKFSPHMDGSTGGGWGRDENLGRMKDGAEDGEVLGSVQPTLGLAAVFRDCLWHDGAELLADEKYLLRTDIMYRREVPFDFESLCDGFDDGGSGKKALALAEALEDAGNYDEAMKWYKKAFRLAPELERGGG